MPAINFQARFADDVESGRKHTTIRRAGRAQPGQTLYLFTDQRTKQCRRIGEALCLGVTSFFINVDGTCWLGGFRLLDDEVESLARLDTAGQMGAKEFVEFFRSTYGLPFDGELIVWSGRNAMSDPNSLLAGIITALVTQEGPPRERAALIFQQMAHWPGLANEEGWKIAIETLLADRDEVAAQLAKLKQNVDPDKRI